MKLLLDTNIILDYYLRRTPFFQDALTLRVAQLFGDVELWVSTQSFSDAEYVMRKFASKQTVRSAMFASLEFFFPCSTVAEDVAPALSSDWDELEDYLIASAACRIEADFLVSRDQTGFRASKVSVVTPQEMLEHLKTVCGLEYEAIEDVTRLAGV